MAPRADAADADLTALSAAEAAARIAAGGITSEQLVEACLTRIGEIEPQLLAWTYLDRERALEEARSADAARRQGRGTGPLHGVPVGVKDIIDAAGMPTEHGCAAFKGRVPETDAACITALRRAGAVVMGKTVTTELATHVASVTRNPRNPAHTPGGSSSGSAAAVAAGMVPLAIGTQTGGSVIRPAAFCGVYGFKPTFGLIARTGMLTQAHSLDTVGVMARSIEDAALFADALQCHDVRDAASLSTSRPRLLATAMQAPPALPRLAFVKTHAWTAAEAATHEAFGSLVARLGAHVAEIDLDDVTKRGLAAARTVQGAELAAHFGPLLGRGVSAPLAERIEAGCSIRGVDYVMALAARESFYAPVEAVLRTHDAILTPAAPGPAPKGLASTGNPGFCAFWTYLGVPAVTLPLLQADGMPVGVQLIGTRRDDGRLLRTARWLTQHLGAA